MFTKIKSVLSRTTLDLNGEDLAKTKGNAFVGALFTVPTVACVVMAKASTTTLATAMLSASAVGYGAIAVGFGSAAIYNVGKGAIEGVQRALNTPLDVTIVPKCDVEIL